MSIVGLCRLRWESRESISDYALGITIADVQEDSAEKLAVSFAYSSVLVLL